MLEIVALPGHTPDAIALLDSEAGYLWTGDSFYEGPIWLFAPETDLGSRCCYAPGDEWNDGVVAGDQPRLRCDAPMSIQVEKVEFSEVRELRDLFRAEAKCQIVRDSILPRGLADPLLVRDGAATLGYAGVWNRHFPGRVMEFFVLPVHRERASACFAAVLNAPEVTAAEAQTNLPLQHGLLLEHVASPVVENLLFGDGPERDLDRPDLGFRPRSPGDPGPEGDWVVEYRGKVVGAGGFLTHYNPPYADLYVEVVPSARGQGVGSFLVQELRRVCRESGKVPAARCDPGNEASRRTLLHGGLVKIGEILAGNVGSARAGTV